MTKKSNETRQRKYGLIDKVAPQESDGEDDRKPFPGKGLDFFFTYLPKFEQNLIPS